MVALIEVKTLWCVVVGWMSSCLNTIPVPIKGKKLPLYIICTGKSGIFLQPVYLEEFVF